MSTTQDAGEAVAAITRDQLRLAQADLESLAMKLERFRSGESGAWTDRDSLALYSLGTIIQSHVSVTRDLRTAEARRGSVIRLSDRRESYFPS